MIALRRTPNQLTVIIRPMSMLDLFVFFISAILLFVAAAAGGVVLISIFIGICVSVLIRAIAKNQRKLLPTRFNADTQQIRYRNQLIAFNEVKQIVITARHAPSNDKPNFNYILNLQLQSRQLQPINNTTTFEDVLAVADDVADMLDVPIVIVDPS